MDTHLHQDQFQRRETPHEKRYQTFCVQRAVQQIAHPATRSAEAAQDIDKPAQVLAVSTAGCASMSPLARPSISSARDSSDRMQAVSRRSLGVMRISNSLPQRVL